MSKLPDCMKSNGVEPCYGFQELQAKLEFAHGELGRWAKDYARLERECNDWKNASRFNADTIRIVCERLQKQ